MTDREKLVAVLNEIEGDVGFICDSCGESKKSICIESFADHLIANGVTVQQWWDAKTDPPTKDGQYLTFISCEVGEWIGTGEFDTASKIWRSVDAYHENATEFVTHWMPKLGTPLKGDDGRE